MNKKTIHGLKIITINRKAYFNYFFKENIKKDNNLKKNKIKSIRSNKSRGEKSSFVC